MKVLVTGANGFIGREIVKELCKDKDIQVNTLTRKPLEGELSLQSKGKNFIADLTSKKDLQSLKGLEKIEIVIHAAGLAHQFGNVPEFEFINVNVRGTENLLERIRKYGIKHFVLISSVAVYGDNKSSVFVTEENICKPKGFYAESKLKAEEICLGFCKSNQIALTILRPATVAGEFDRGNLYRLIKFIDRGFFIWVGNGENKKSFVYKNDVARACKKVICKGVSKDENIFNISANPIKVKKIVNVVSEVLEKNVFGIKIPPKLLKSSLKFFSNLTGSSRILNVSKTLKKWLSDEVYSSKKFVKEYDFEFRYSAEEAIRKETIWFKNRR